MFDAKASNGKGTCLNDKLLQGPDRNNSLRGVVVRFRCHPYAVKSDVANMFHNIRVKDPHPNYLRFFWYQDNDPSKELIEYMALVHVMGLTSSPAIANLAVRYAARETPPVNGREWIREDDLLDPFQIHAVRIPDPLEEAIIYSFYVDDSLDSEPTPEKLLEFIQTAVSRLKRYELELCKVYSNSDWVQPFFHVEEKWPNLMSLAPADLSSHDASLG